MNCVILTIVPGLGRPSMESTVTRSSQKSPDIRTIGSSFLLPVIGTTTTLTWSDPSVTIGHRPSIRTIRATRTFGSSIHPAPARSTTAGLSAFLSVLSQNKNKGGSAVRCSEASNRGDARRQPSIPDKIAMTKQEIYKSEQSNDKDIVLYPEGKYYKAYERSAWRLCMLVHEFKASSRCVGTAGACVVWTVRKSLTFPDSPYQYLQRPICIFSGH